VLCKDFVLTDGPVERLDEMNDKEKLIWIAGFFCGEGCVSINKLSGSVVCNGNVALVQKDKAPLDFIFEALKLYNIDVPTVKEYKVMSPNNDENFYYKLQFSNNHASRFLELIMPFPIGEKHLRRAKLFVKIFPASLYSKRHIRLSDDIINCRRKYYEEWQKLLALEQLAALEQLIKLG